MKRRSKLMLLALSALVLGGVITTFAVTTDSAQTGTNRIDSGASAADLQISHDAILATSYSQAPYSGNCNTQPPGGSYVDNQTQGFGVTTGLINQTGARPATMAAGAQVTYFCLKNAGPTTLTLTSEQVAGGSDADLACSPDEAAQDPGSCGTGAGELASEIRTETYVGPANGTCVNPVGSPAAADATTSNDSLDGAVRNFSSAITITPTNTRCIAVAAGYLDTLTTASERDANQTDRQEFFLQYNATT